ncbi:MAG: DUF1659 domain-containing protein [Thermoanaerobacterales bacterium]|jgi:hypothetical protein|nr:DUF1659 domain-containing protein [Thermoanaerobacterales bacterium]
MPVVSTPVDSTLQLVFQTGVDEDDKPIFRTRSFRGVKTDAADEDVMSVAQQLIGLQIHPANAVKRVLVSELIET